MSTIMPRGSNPSLGEKWQGFPVTPFVQDLINKGMTSAQDSTTKKHRCIRLLPSGNYCGRELIMEGNEGGWDLDAKGYGGCHWRCPLKHDPKPQYDPEAHPKVLSVEVRQKFDKEIIAQDEVRLANLKGLLSKATTEEEKKDLAQKITTLQSSLQKLKISGEVPGDTMETKATKDEISFKLSLDELVDKNLINSIVQKLLVSLDEVPCANTKEYKRVAAIQEQISRFAGPLSDNPKKLKVKTSRKRKSHDKAPSGQAESQSPSMTGSDGSPESLTIT